MHIMSQKKIVHIIESMKTGGAQKLLADLLPELKRLDADVELVVARKENNPYERKLESAGINIVDLGIGNARNPLFIKSLRRYLKSHKTEIALLHVHLFPSLYVVPLSKIGLGLKAVYTEHSTSNRRNKMKWIRPIEKIIYSQYSKIIGISEQVSQSISLWVGKRISSNVLTVHNGINLQDFSKIQSNPVDKRNDDTRIAMMISRFAASKDQETVVKSIPYVEDENCLFVFAGDGETLPGIKALADSIGVANRCKFLGNVDDIPSLIKHADVGIQSSNWEGFGLTAVEFMASGVPMIATDVPGLSDVVRGAGALVNPKDPADMAEKLNEILKNPSTYNTMVEKGIQRAHRYEIKQTAKRLLEIYSSIKQSS